MKDVIVKLAGRDYDLKPLPIRSARAVRLRFSGLLNRLVVALQQFSHTEINDIASMGSVMATFGEVLLGSPEQGLDILCEYAPNIKADRERIEAEGFDEEVIHALVEVVKLLFPFGELANLIPQTPVGQEEKTTTKS